MNWFQSTLMRVFWRPTLQAASDTSSAGMSPLTTYICGRSFMHLTCSAASRRKECSIKNSACSIGKLFSPQAVQRLASRWLRTSRSFILRFWKFAISRLESVDGIQIWCIGFVPTGFSWCSIKSCSFGFCRHVWPVVLLGIWNNRSLRHLRPFFL